MFRLTSSNTTIYAVQLCVTNKPDTPLVPLAEESKYSDLNQFLAECHKIVIGVYELCRLLHD